MGSEKRQQKDNQRHRNPFMPRPQRRISVHWAMAEIEIRVCKTWNECVACEELQYVVWGPPDYREVVPAHLLITAVKNGGLLIGAFEQGKMMGFAFGFLGYDHDAGTLRLKHTSHMLGVLPGIRSQGLGAALKWKQREEALKQGLELMTWTYDPLQAINAHLNLTRLGAIARRYIRDAYGEMTDELNAGIPSDRFEVEWFLTSRRVESLADRAESPVLNDARQIYQVTWDAEGYPFVGEIAELAGSELIVEIPADITEIKRRNLALARQWRAWTRETFERAFSAGYAATGLVQRQTEPGRRHVWYVLRRQE
jgi:predicted GNAT superfamily acetyltransferase